MKWKVKKSTKFSVASYTLIGVAPEYALSKIVRHTPRSDYEALVYIHLTKLSSRYFTELKAAKNYLIAEITKHRMTK